MTKTRAAQNGVPEHSTTDVRVDPACYPRLGPSVTGAVT